MTIRRALIIVAVAIALLAVAWLLWAWKMGGFCVSTPNALCL
jgi:multidrug resistance efflux pump